VKTALYQQTSISKGKNTSPFMIDNSLAPTQKAILMEIVAFAKLWCIGFAGHVDS
jgi:hypothetical protein